MPGQEERILPDLPLLDSEQRSVIVRLLAYRARLDGDALQESKWLAKADPLGWDQWSIGDPYLWLGKKLSDKGLEECSAGPLSIFSWYTDQQSTNAQGWYLQGELLYWRGDHVGAQRVLARRVPTRPASFW